MASFTSKPSPVSLGTNGSNRALVYTATKVTEGVGPNGQPVFRSEVIRYNGPKGDSPVVIATGDSTKPGVLTPTSNATATEKSSLSEGGAIRNANKTQVESLRKDFFGSSSGGTSEQKNSFSSLGAAKKTTDPNSADNASAQEIADLNKSLESSSETRDSFPKNLVYPSTLQVRHQDVMRFSMLKYDPKGFSNENLAKDLNPFGNRSATSSRIIGTVTLPIQNNIGDSNSAGWGEGRMDNMEAFRQQFASTFIAGGGGAAANTASAGVEGVQNNSGAVQSAILAKFTEAATGTTDFLSRAKGAVINPNLELLFQGPTLRPFAFSFKLSARDVDDREAIRKIIRFFKQGSAVQKTTANLFLKAPHTFKIQYLYKGTTDHPYINQIKECALTNFSVNYTPDGSYSTYADGLMTSYEITMQFQELEPIFNDDYTKLDGNNDTTIGY